MEKDFMSFLLHQQPNVQLLNARSSALPFDVGMQSLSTPYAAPGVKDTVSMNRNYPITPLPLPSKAVEPHGWFYPLPHFKPGFISGGNIVLNEKPLPTVELPDKVPASTSRCSPKQFLVFDQSGDKTTLIYSSGIGTPVCLNSWNSNSKPLNKYSPGDVGKFSMWSKRQNFSGPSLTDEPNANCSEAEDKCETHEDTEEINALLYSDDDSAQDEEDDEISTGHSPSMMTACDDDKQDEFEVEDGAEVASSCGPTKRQRTSEDGYCVPSVMETGTSAKLGKTFMCEDDAESRCSNDHGLFLNHDSMSGMKRSRKESIRETIEILQSILPGGQGKGKDASVVLDESIRYLRSLKHTIKSLGLSAF